MILPTNFLTLGLSLNVISLLPRLILNFEDPDDLSKTTAENIEQVLCDSGSPY